MVLILSSVKSKLFSFNSSFKNSVNDKPVSRAPVIPSIAPAPTPAGPANAPAPAPAAPAPIEAGFSIALREEVATCIAAVGFLAIPFIKPLIPFPSASYILLKSCISSEGAKDSMFSTASIYCCKFLSETFEPEANTFIASSTVAPCPAPVFQALYISPKKSVTSFLPKALSIAVSFSGPALTLRRWFLDNALG